MGDVIELRPRAAAKNKTAMVLASMMEQESAGDLEGSVHITQTGKGTDIHILGACADRLQVGAWALIKGLNFMADKIVANGTLGNTPGTGPIALSFPKPRRELPKRLREATNFGDLK